MSFPSWITLASIWYAITITMNTSRHCNTLITCIAFPAFVTTEIKLWLQNRLFVYQKYLQVSGSVQIPCKQVWLHLAEIVFYIKFWENITIVFLRISQCEPSYLSLFLASGARLQSHSKGRLQPPWIHPPKGIHVLQSVPSL